MNEKQEQTDWLAWYSTYGLLTAERILERFHIHLSHDDLIRAMKDHHSVYFQLLRVPMKNVFNGIILQQAHDYQIYAQKLFVDYLLSGEDAKEKDSNGAMTREDIEQQRLKLVELGEEFRMLEGEHEILIAESQGALIELTQDLNVLKQTMVNDPLTIAHAVSTYHDRAEDINTSLRGYRSQFYNLILRVTELLGLLTEYRIDEEKIAENKMTLEFDALIGEA